MNRVAPTWILTAQRIVDEAEAVAQRLGSNATRATYEAEFETWMNKIAAGNDVTPREEARCRGIFLGYVDSIVKEK